MSFYINRIHFIKNTLATILYTSNGAYGQHLMHPSKKLKVGLIGTGWYGKSDLFRLMQVTEIEVAALCDVDKNHLSNAASLVMQRNKQPKSPSLFTEFRKMLSSAELDIVPIGTPDHWHALNTIASLSAGCHADVPYATSVDVMEGGAIVKAAIIYHRVVQVGTQRRSTPLLVGAKTNIIGQGLLS